MPSFTIDAERVQTAVVTIQADSREAITDARIAAALDRLPDREWKTFDYGVVIQQSQGAPARSTLAARAAEIGISLPTIQRWRAAGVDVFDDAAVKAHISRQRVHNWKIATRFKASL